MQAASYSTWHLCVPPVFLSWTSLLRLLFWLLRPRKVVGGPCVGFGHSCHCTLAELTLILPFGNRKDLLTRFVWCGSKEWWLVNCWLALSLPQCALLFSSLLVSLLPSLCPCHPCRKRGCVWESEVTRLSAPVTSPPCVLRSRLSLILEHTVLARLAGLWALWSVCLYSLLLNFLMWTLEI